jgi:hypothetical protein
MMHGGNQACNMPGVGRVQMVPLFSVQNSRSF